MSMFIHSTRVPRLYKIASQLLQEVRENGVSLKEELFKRKHPNLKGILALVAETIKNFSQINEVIEKTNLSEKEPQLNLWLARILICELLWKNRELKDNCKPIVTILNYRKELAKHKESLNLPASDSRVNKPRFVRVNTLKLTVEDAVYGFCDEGWYFMRSTSTNYDDFLSQVASLNFDQFMIDIHLKELLIFPAKTQFYAHQAYIHKAIALQDKASCLPVHLLNPPPNSVVLDMCAAPGMKTTYIAALMKNEGVIYAVELDSRRFDLLNKSLEGTEATCIKTINNDALKVTAEDCPNVEYILVDPSCSGSGMTNRVLLDDKEKPNESRLRTLSRFQIIILKHALTHFPQAKRVVYSTCSIYREENEDVVEEVLRQCKNFKLVSAKRLLNKENCEPQEGESVSDRCLNFNCENDLTNGFFIAVFERVENQPGDFKKCKKGESKWKKQIEGENQDFDEESCLQESKPKKKKKARKEEDEQNEGEETRQLNVLQGSESKESTDVTPTVINGTLSKTKKKKKAKKEEDEQNEGEETRQLNVLQESELKENTDVTPTVIDGTLSKTKKKKKAKKEGKEQNEGEETRQLNVLQESEPKENTDVTPTVIDGTPPKTKKKKNQINENVVVEEESCLLESDSKRKKKNKKRKNEEDNAELEQLSNHNEPERKKKKKCKSKVEDSLPEDQEREIDEVLQESEHISKKNKKSSREKIEIEEETMIFNKKKKNSEKMKNEIEEETQEIPEISKKRKHRKHEIDEPVPNEQAETEEPPKKKKKKNRSN